MKRSLASLSLLTLALVACAPTTDSGPIKIGYLGPLTGDAAGYGTDTVNGTRMAVEEINAKGGINGRLIELIAEDARCNGSDAASAAQKLVSVDKVVAIVGGQCSSETLAAAPIAEAAKVVLISPLSSSPDVTKAGDFVFRDYPSDALKGKAFGNYFAKAGYKHIAIVTENTDFCQGILAVIKENLPAETTLVFAEQVDQGTKDYRSLFTRLKKTDFDVFIANGQSDATVAEMAKQLRELGMKQQIVGTDTSDSANLGKAATEAVEGLKPLSVPLLTEKDPTGATFVPAFKAKYGEPQFSAFFAATAYDAVNMLATVIAEKGTDGEKIRDGLYGLTDYKGISGTLSFDSNGDVRGIPFAMKQFKNGVLEQAELIPID